MQQRQLGPFTVSGLGCMNICHAYGAPVPEQQAERLLLAALDAGVTHFDTAALYGFGLSETLVGKSQDYTFNSPSRAACAAGPQRQRAR